MNTMDKHANRRRELYALLGDLPQRNRPIKVTQMGEEDRGGYVLEKLLLDLNGHELVPAFFVRPHQKSSFPAILYNHWHGGNYDLGKKEILLGNAGLQPPPYAEELTRRGIAALAIDAWGFGERQGRTESEIFKEMLWQGQVMWGMMVYDSLRALDYLADRSDVDRNYLGTLGISMGSTMAWWLAALDVRIRVCIDICCLTDYEELIHTQGLDAHGIYYYVPGLLKHFTTAQINALISPRAHLAMAGCYDVLTPPKGLEKIDAELQEVYRKDGAANAWELVTYVSGHMETPDMRIKIRDFLNKYLLG